jgi:dihydrolipoamide dehydrogenase
LPGGQTLEAELLLVAVGRGPFSSGLGYAEAGVELDRGFVTVNERLETSVPGVYAVGDLVAGPQLAHRGFAHGIFVAEDIAHRLGRCDRAPAPVTDTAIPRVTYCDPEVASVGLTEQAARDAGHSVAVGREEFTGVAKARAIGQTRGFVQLVADADTDRLLGCHIVGPDAGNLIHEAVIAMVADAPYRDIGRAIHIHPTLAEGVNAAAGGVHRSSSD